MAVKEQRVTKEDSSPMYKLNRKITGICTIKPIQSESSDSETELASTDGELYLALYTSDPKDKFC